MQHTVHLVIRITLRLQARPEFRPIVLDALQLSPYFVAVVVFCRHLLYGHVGEWFAAEKLFGFAPYLVEALPCGHAVVDVERREIGEIHAVEHGTHEERADADLKSVRWRDSVICMVTHVPQMAEEVVGA